MKEEKDKWIADVFNSLEGSTRAVPDPGLLARIEAELEKPSAKVLPLSQWRMVAVAASFLILLNVWTITQYVQQGGLEASSSSWETEAESRLISNYSLYDL